MAKELKASTDWAKDIMELYQDASSKDGWLVIKTCDGETYTVHKNPPTCAATQITFVDDGSERQVTLSYDQITSVSDHYG